MTWFTTMGMFIIDEIHFEKHSVYDIVGGAGTYGVLGARFFAGKERAKEIGWIVDAGNDFPQSVEDQISSWNTGLVPRRDSGRKTTRGWNSYGDNDLRSFKYLTPKKRIEVADLHECGLDSARSIHVICSPDRCMKICSDLAGDGSDRPHEQVFLWEPVPDCCCPETFSTMLEALNSVQVLSPNCHEAALFVGLPEPTTVADIESLVYTHWAPHLDKLKTVFVLRCGKLGVLVYNNKQLKWYPAYHQSSEKVVDPTGGGNTFVGGFLYGYIESGGDLDTAASYGNVAAGLAVEQVGVPLLSYQGEQELWNGTVIKERLQEYAALLEGVRQRQE
ncbi:Protein MAK32 [Yarrowia sp. C11]|nr:Protein MAK32 [Yarrowia sp. E02]KAG5371807.1 Protein MAK32 [Yarrowia sp. C11]